MFSCLGCNRINNDCENLRVFLERLLKSTLNQPLSYKIKFICSKKYLLLLYICMVKRNKA
jgi:hypothetical protein